MSKAFWVNQGGTYQDELAAGLLWAPERTEKGFKLVHWEALVDVRPGDVIFNYANSHLRGFASASSIAVLMSRPYESGSAYSTSQGGRAVFCTYHELERPIPLVHVTDNPELRRELQSGRNAVLDVNGKVAQKYLCEVSQEAASLLGELVGFNWQISPSEEAIGATTALRLADARLGQGKFREDLIDHFGGACAVTGLAISCLLRASHIKAWTVSSNRERLDPENGVLLAAGVDAAFDRGYIGFCEEGRLLTKSTLNEAHRIALGIPVVPFNLPLKYLTQARQSYLAFHRSHFDL